MCIPCALASRQPRLQPRPRLSNFPTFTSVCADIWYAGT